LAQERSAQERSAQDRPGTSERPAQRTDEAQTTAPNGPGLLRLLPADAVKRQAVHRFRPHDPLHGDRRTLSLFDQSWRSFGR